MSYISVQLSWSFFKSLDLGYFLWIFSSSSNSKEFHVGNEILPKKLKITRIFCDKQITFRIKCHCNWLAYVVTLSQDDRLKFEIWWETIDPTCLFVCQIDQAIGVNGNAKWTLQFIDPQFPCERRNHVAFVINIEQRFLFPIRHKNILLRVQSKVFWFSK